MTRCAINGTARVLADADYFDAMAVKGKRPILALEIDVEEVFFHCSKAFLRSDAWKPETWDPTAVPCVAQLAKAIKPDMSQHELDDVLQRGQPAQRCCTDQRAGVTEWSGRRPAVAHRLAVVRAYRREAISVTIGVLLLVAAFVVPHLHLDVVTPLLNSHARTVPQLCRHVTDVRLVEGPRRVGHRPGDPHRRWPRCCGARHSRSGCPGGP